MRVEIRPSGPKTDWRAVHALLTLSFAYMKGRIDPAILARYHDP